MDATTSDYVAIVITLGVLFACIAGAILFTRYVKQMMKLEAENRRRFADDHGLMLLEDKSMKGVFEGLSISFVHVHVLHPATGMGEGPMKTRPGRIEMLQIQAAYPAEYSWFACERRAGKRYLDNDEQPTTWVAYHRDQLEIPSQWQEVPCDDEHFTEHYVVYAEGDRFPAFPNSPKVLRWLWAKTAFFVVARDGLLTIWIPELEYSGEAKKLYENLVKTLNHTRSICSPTV